MSKLGKVGPYTLLERLGRGGMGEVYLAGSRRGERVALKVLHDLAEDDSSRIRLEREVRALRRVESPYVAKVLDADLDCTRPYLVMEHIEGVTLLDRVRQDGPLDLAELVQMAQGVAAALAIIHAAGVVHRDLKPANIIMGTDGPVLIDFGIAQVLDATRLTMTGTFLGTPGYTAPEIFADEQVDSPADIHAWAATVAFAATGRPAFGRGTAEAQMYAVLNGQADLKGVPVALLPLVRAALNREPAKRPTAALLADRLSRLARATGAAEPASSGPGLLAAPVVEDTRGRTGEEARPPAPRKPLGDDGRGSGPRPRPGGDAAARARTAADGGVRGRTTGEAGARGRTADDEGVRGRTASEGGLRGRTAGETGPRGRATGEPGARGMPGGDTDPRGRTAGADGGARSRPGAEGAVPPPRGRTSTESARGRAATEAARGRQAAEGARARATGAEAPRARASSETTRGRTGAEGVRGRAGADGRARARESGVPARVRARAAIGSARSRRGAGAEPEPGGGLPAGSAALLLLAVLAVPCVVASVMWPIASVGITAVFVVLTRTVWLSHWMVRNRSARRWRVALRTVLFPFALAGSVVTAAVWPGVPVTVAAGGALWLTGGGQIGSDWWQQPAPVTAAAVVFGMLCGGITGREIERIGARLPELRREGLRALAVLGGFVALCAAAVRAIALLL